MDNQTPTPSQSPAPPDDFESRRHGRHRGGGASPIFIGLILILLGVMFFLANQGIVGWGEWWKYFLIGLGGIFLVDAAIRSGQENYRGFVIGRVVSGFVLISTGVLFLFGFTT
jgi:hypothetical protein